MLKHDEIEYNEEYREIFKKVNKEVEEILKTKNIKKVWDIYIFLKNIKRKY